MIDPRLLAIPFAFILLAAIACWYAISAKGSWLTKLLLIVTVPSFGILGWYSMTSYLGWPTSQSVSGKMLLLWASVQEPNTRTGAAGSIYIWVIPIVEEQIGSPDMLAYRPTEQEPRAYWLKYSRKAHEQLFRAQQKRRKGKAVVLEFGKEGPEGISGFPRGQSDESEEIRGGTENRGPQYEGVDQDFRMYDLPAPQLPPKEEEE